MTLPFWDAVIPVTRATRHLRTPILIDSDPSAQTRATPNDALFLRFVALATLLAAGLVWVSTRVFDGQIWVLPFGVFCTIAVFAGQGLRWWYPRETLGACNLVTLTRSVLVAGAAGLILEPQLLETAGWWVLGVVLTAFALDGVDGWLARKWRMASAFGAQFDMEVDALFGAILSLIALSSGRVGYEVLVLGFARYAFLVAALVWPWMRAPLRGSMTRKTICVIQIAALVAIISPVVPSAAMLSISLAASALLLWSFGRDILWLARAGQ